MKQKRNPNRINELRLNRKWSQSELAEKAGAHWVTISKLERGEMRLTQDWMKRLADALGVEPAELIADAPLTRTVYVSGNLNDKGIADNLTLENDQPMPFQIALGAKEPDRTVWYFVNTDAYYPIMSNGDLIRFTYPAFNHPSTYLHKLCLVEIQESGDRDDVPKTKKIVGVLSPSQLSGRYDVQIAGAAPLRGVVVVDAAPASMIVLSPAHVQDEDGYPLP
ncbi:helix-turn-helix domain-containing protein [Methylobacterium sp. ID0610]|uniref:helix-turn-helix domain-containing protein n=1 Tax=Methylobacterium carpenticola TaxID=3344827 RepID=UPI00369B13EC